MKHTLLSVSQAAAIKGISRTAIYAAIKRETLPSRIVAGHRVVREADLLAWDSSKTLRGRRKGQAMTEEHRANIAKAQKERWARRKPQTNQKP